MRKVLRVITLISFVIVTVLFTIYKPDMVIFFNLEEVVAKHPYELLPIPLLFLWIVAIPSPALFLILLLAIKDKLKKFQLSL